MKKLNYMEIPPQIHKYNGTDWVISPNSENKSISKYDVAFLLAPVHPIPNASGNAIVTLTTTLAAELPYKTIIFSATPSDLNTTNKLPSNINVAYYKKNITRHYWDENKILAYFRYYFITPTKFSWRSYAKSAAEACLKLGVKCLVIENVADFVWVVRFLRKLNISVVLHQHAFTQKNYQTFLWKKIEQNLDKIIFVANKTLELTETKHGKILIPKSIIYNGVDLDLYNPHTNVNKAEQLRNNLDLHPGKRVIAYIGRLAASKGVLQAIKAFIILNRKDVVFLVIGGIRHPAPESFIQELNTLREEVDQQNLSLYYFENIHQEALPPYYLLADYILVPSDNYYEGLPKVVTEALAMGVPVVASERGGIWELLEEGINGWKISDPITENSILETLQKALSISNRSLDEMKENIIQTYRPRMNKEIMVSRFQKEIAYFLDPK